MSVGELTDLLQAWKEGDREAEEQVWTVVYDELRRLARQVRYGRTLHGRPGTTTIVHEAYLRLLGENGIDWKGRRHFFAVAARAMRFLLVDRARRSVAQKRTAEVVDLPNSLEDVPDNSVNEDILAVHQALEQLADVNPRHEKLVELHYFSGLSLQEAAEVLGISRRTAVRDWKAVKIWLHGELRLDTSAEGS